MAAISKAVRDICRKLVVEQGYGYREAAAILGITHAAISDWAKAESWPKPGETRDKVKTLALLLDGATKEPEVTDDIQGVGRNVMSRRDIQKKTLLEVAEASIRFTIEELASRPSGPNVIALGQLSLQIMKGIDGPKTDLESEQTADIINARIKRLEKFSRPAATKADLGEVPEASKEDAH